LRDIIAVSKIPRRERRREKEREREREKEKKRGLIKFIMLYNYLIYLNIFQCTFLHIFCMKNGIRIHSNFTRAKNEKIKF